MSTYIKIGMERVQKNIQQIGGMREWGHRRWFKKNPLDEYYYWGDRLDKVVNVGRFDAFLGVFFYTY